MQRHWRCPMQWRTTAFLALALSVSAGCGSDEPTVIEGVHAIVFASRATRYEDGTPAVVSGDNQVLDYQRWVPGGHLYVLSPPTSSGTLTDLVPGEDQADFQGLDVSFDGKEVVFSMKRSADERYHLYLVNVDDVGASLRQIT